MNRIKGQVSTELIVILAAVMIVFIPILVTVYIKAGEGQLTVEKNQAQLAASRIANMINTIGSLGDNSSILLEVYLPVDTQNISIKNVGQGSEVTIALETIDGRFDASKTARFNVEMAPADILEKIESGKVKLKFTSKDGFVIVERHT